MEKGIETRLFGTDFITKVLKESQITQGQEGKTCLRRRCWKKTGGMSWCWEIWIFFSWFLTWHASALWTWQRTTGWTGNDLVTGGLQRKLSQYHERYRLKRFIIFHNRHNWFWSWDVVIHWNSTTKKRWMFVNLLIWLLRIKFILNCSAWSESKSKA